MRPLHYSIMALALALAACIPVDAVPGTDTGTDLTEDHPYARGEAELALSSFGTDVYVDVGVPDAWTGTVEVVARTDGRVQTLLVDVTEGLGEAQLEIDPCVDAGLITVEGLNALGDELALELDAVDFGAFAAATGTGILVVCGEPDPNATEYTPDPSMLLSVDIEADWNIQLQGAGAAFLTLAESGFALSGGDTQVHMWAGQWTVIVADPAEPFSITMFLDL